MDQDVSGVLETMSDGVQGCFRGYFGYGDPIVGVDGKAQMSTYYEKLFAAARVTEVFPVQFRLGEWYLFSDLHWKLTLRDSGEHVQMRTAELMPLASDGRILARVGWGTPLFRLETADYTPETGGVRNYAVPPDFVAPA
jgi:hypothetical protein